MYSVSSRYSSGRLNFNLTYRRGDFNYLNQYLSKLSLKKLFEG